MFNIGPAELIVILLVALLIVGPKRLPEVGKSVGKALREIRRQTDEVRSTFEMNLDDDDVEPVHDITGDATTEDPTDPGSAGEAPGELPATVEDAAPTIGEPTGSAAPEPAVAAAEPARRRRKRKDPAPADGPGATDPS